MKALTIRNIPDDLYEVIQRIAKINRRSLQQQILVFLERARFFNNESPLDRAREIRRQLQGRDLGNTIAEIREERQR